MRAIFFVLPSLLLVSPLSAAMPSQHVGNIQHPGLPSVYENAGYGSVMASNGYYLAMGAPRAKLTYQECGSVDLISPAGWYGAKLLCPGGLPGANFGASLAWAGNYLVVGAPQAADGGVSLQGLVFVYPQYPVQSNSQPHTLRSPTLEAGFEYYGRAVAASATRIAVGALGANTAAASTGIVHVYAVSNGVPGALLYSIPNPSPDSWESFGSQLAIHGNRLIIADPGDEGGQGKVWVHDMAGSTPEVPILVIDNPQASAETEAFGSSLSLEGARLAVGARDSLGQNGRAYVFDLQSATPATPQFTFANPTPFVWEAFGHSIAVNGDRLLIGAVADDQQGAAYLYDLAGSSPTTALLRFDTPLTQLGGAFGSAVAFGPTTSTVFVGAAWHSVNAPGSGEVYRYEITGSTASAPVPAAMPLIEGFAQRVCLLGDWLITGDERHVFGFDLSLGTPANPSWVRECLAGNDIRITNIVADGDWIAVAVSQNPYTYGVVSRVHVLKRSDIHAPWITIERHHLGATSGFAGGIAISGDRLALAATGTTNGVVIYDLTSATPTLPALTLPVTNIHSLAMSGDRLAATRHSSTLSTPTLVFDLASATPTTPISSLPQPASPGTFESSRVRMSGTRLLITYLVNGLVGNRVFSYDLSAPNPAATAVELPSPNLPDSQFFGTNISLHGDTAYVGIWPRPTSSPGTRLLALGYDLSLPDPTVPVAGLSISQPFFTPAGFAHDGARAIVSVVDAPPSAYRVNWGAITVHVPAAPNLALAIENNTPITSGHHFDLGLREYMQPSSFTLTVRNLGSDPLTLYSLTPALAGQPARLRLHSDTNPSFPITIAAGGSLSFNAITAQNVFGSFNETMRLLSNDEDSSSVQLSFSGYSATTQEMWRQQHFGTISNTGRAADSADPDGDGQTNAAEFLVNASPVDAASRLSLEIQSHPGIAGQKQLVLHPAVPATTPTRPVAIYKFEVSTHLGSWQTLWEGNSLQGNAVIPDAGSQGQTARFYRVSVR